MDYDIFSKRVFGYYHKNNQIFKTGFIMKNLLLWLFFLLATFNLQSQDSEEIQKLKIRLSDSPETAFTENLYQPKGVVKLAAYKAFMVYKKYISSQDYGNCSFTPSCSEYAIIAINKQGLVIGSINALDRLTRCNGRNKGYYSVDVLTGLLIDEVRNIRYEKD